MRFSCSRTRLASRSSEAFVFSASASIPSASLLRRSAAFISALLWAAWAARAASISLLSKGRTTVQTALASVVLSSSGAVAGSVLGGVIGKNYAEAQNRITIKSYTDVVSTAWYAKYVDDVTAKELMGGSNGKFDPNGNMNRAMLVTVLYRMAGSPDVEGKVSEKFKDCKDGAYYEKAVLWAAANGIVGGYSDGTFKPTNPVNRQELAKILYGYDLFAKRVGQDFAVELTYTDLDQIPDWALEAVNYCSAAGYLQGSNGVFNPKGKTTRCQAAKVLSVMAA